jgi:hypothetical protein
MEGKREFLYTKDYDILWVGGWVGGYYFAEVRCKNQKGKAIPVTGREGLVRRRGSHIVSKQSVHRWR